MLRRFPLFCLLTVLLLTGGVSTACAGPEDELSAADRERFERAFEHLYQDEYEEARRLAERGDNPLPAKIIKWYDLTRASDGGDYEEARGFAEENPHWPRGDRIARRVEGLMPPGVARGEVLSWFEDHPPQTPYGAERYAEALAAEGRPEEAGVLLRETWVNASFTAAEERTFRQRYGHLLDEQLELERLERLVWSGHQAAAERQAARLDDGRKTLARARLMLRAGQPGVDAAIKRVPAALQDDPGLIFERASWRQRRGWYEETIELLDPPLADAPYAERWWPLRHWAARRAFEEGDLSVAYRIAAHHGLDRGVGFAQGEWLAGWIALRHLEEPDTALQHFTRLYDGVTTPVSQARSAYWAGRAAEAAGLGEEARRWYETAAQNLTAYYGQLAAAKLGERSFLALPNAPRVTQEEESAFNERELVKVMRLLAALDQPRRIDVFAHHLAGRVETPQELKLLADLLRDLDRSDLSVRIARQARSGEMILPEHLFPVLPIVLDGRSDIDPALVLALIRQESSFNPTVVSPAGARGLMQLMPRTAEAMAQRLEVPYSASRLLNDPDYNLTLGQRYLRVLLDRYEGSLLLAVAAYNAGPSRVDSWLRNYGDPRDGWTDPIDWIETIPFYETRNYVQRIFEAMTIYRHRLEPTKVAVRLDHDILLEENAPVLGAREVSCCL